MTTSTLAQQLRVAQHVVVFTGAEHQRKVAFPHSEMR